MNKLIIILDGASDSGFNTPLKLANIPNLNFLAKNGKCGLMDVINKDIAPESDEAMISLLGFNVKKVYTGRGILEALGSKIKVKNKVYLRANFASLNEDGSIKNIEAPPSKKEILKIKKEFKKLDILFIHTIGYRGVLIINTKSPKVTPSHPGYELKENFLTTAIPLKNKKLYPKFSKPLEKAAIETSKIINQITLLSKFLLKDKVILTRGASNKLPKLKPLKNFILIADMPVELAIGKLCKMKVMKKPKSLIKLSRIVLKNIKNHNIYIEIKGPDSFAHQGNKMGKIKAIEKIDKEFISKIKDLKNTIIYITCDHSTPCNLKAHSNDPVPVLIYGKGKDNCPAFNEIDCKNGSLERFHGKNLLTLL
ncbi:hypothetical protein HY498_00925 [Candidatus Woesearchaeota archaeon]|nr:hypothetical protein [Candidatus Woesearchaeota archaeon]